MYSVLIQNPILHCNYITHSYTLLIHCLFVNRCPICMNEFLQGDPIRLLPCMHYYHTRCIDEWLMRAITCPNCMQRVDIAFQRTTGRGHRRSVSRGSAASIVMASPSRNTSFDQLTTPSVSVPPTSSSSTPSLPLSGNSEATRNVSFNI